MIKELFDLVASRTGFAKGTLLHMGAWPQEQPDRCVLVAFSGGVGVFFELPDREDLLVNVYSRSKDYNQGHDDSMTVFNAFHGKAGLMLPVVVSGERWEAMAVMATNPPQYFGPDEKGRHQFSTTYIWRIKDASK